MSDLFNKIAFVCVIIAFLTGCEKAQPPEVRKEYLPKDKPFIIGLIPEQNIFKQLERYEPLAVYLSRKTGIKIELKVLSRYGNIIDNFISSGMDGAFFGSFTFALAKAKLGVEALARPEKKGISTYHGLIFVRKESGIRTAGQMAGKVFAFVDKATTAGYLLPLAYFRENGIKNFRAYFSETYFTGTHEDAIYDVLNKRADIGAAKNTVFDRLAAVDPRIKKELVILERSPDVPENGLAVRKDCEPAVKERLKEALLNMHKDQEGKGVLDSLGFDRFIATTGRDYLPVYRCASDAGLDLTVYDYIND